MCDSFLLSSKRWTYHSCCIYCINISLLQWRLWGNLHRQKCSGDEDPTKGRRRSFLDSKTSTLEQRDWPNPLFLRRQWGSCASEASLTQQHGSCQQGQCLPPWSVSSQEQAIHTHRIRITYPFQSSAGVIALWGGALLWYPLSGKPSHPCLPKRMYCPSQSSQNHTWPSLYQAAVSADFFHWVLAERAVVSVTKWMTCLTW